MTKLQAPWYIFGKKLKALFGSDPDIKVGDVFECDGSDAARYAIHIDVRRHEKYNALRKLLPAYKIFGNVKLAIVLFDEENINDASDKFTLYTTAFNGNPIVDNMVRRKDQTGTEFLFIQFKPEVIQFFADNTADYNGNYNGLAQDIARDVFGGDYCGVNFCTAPICATDNHSCELHSEGTNNGEKAEQHFASDDKTHDKGHYVYESDDDDSYRIEITCDIFDGLF